MILRTDRPEGVPPQPAAGSRDTTPWVLRDLEAIREPRRRADWLEQRQVKAVGGTETVVAAHDAARAHG